MTDFRAWIFFIVFFLFVSYGLFADSQVVIEVKKVESGKNSGYVEATFAGGCFWCMQPPFDSLTGVVETVVGYSGGKEKNPTYEQVWQGKTGHAEAIRVVYDPAKIDYETLLETFWINIDPTQEDGQFADRGRHYRTAIFYHDDSQKEKALLSKKRLGESGKFKKPIVTSVEKFVSFYRAEELPPEILREKPDSLRQLQNRFGESRLYRDRELGESG